MISMPTQRPPPLPAAPVGCNHETVLRHAVDLKATLSLVKSVLENHPWSESTIREIQRSIQEIEERASDKSLYLAVIGEFSVGKSSFINALLRENLLKSDVIQGTTAAPTFIRQEQLTWRDRLLNIFGIKAPRKLILKYHGGKVESRRYRKIDAFKAALHAAANHETNAREIERITIEHSSDSLADGLVIIDTPGLNSDNQRHSEVVEWVVNHMADGVVILTSAVTPLPQSLLGFVHRHLGDSVARSALVVTQADLIEAPERARHLAFIKARFGREFSLQNPLVQSVSPKTVLENRSATAVEWLSSFREAEITLKEFLRQQRTALLAERTAKLLSRLLAALHSELSNLDAQLRIRQTALELERPTDDLAFFQEKRTDYLHHFALQSTRVFVDSDNWLEGLRKAIKESVLCTARNCSNFSELRSELFERTPRTVDERLKNEIAGRLQLIDHALNRLARELDLNVRAEYFAAYPQVFQGAPPSQMIAIESAKIPPVAISMASHLMQLQKTAEEVSTFCFGLGFLVDVFKDPQQVRAKMSTAAEASVDALFRAIESRLRDATKTIAENYTKSFDQCMLRIAAEYGARVKAVAARCDRALWEVMQSRQQIKVDLARVGERDSEIAEARKRFVGAA